MVASEHILRYGHDTAVLDATVDALLLDNGSWDVRFISENLPFEAEQILSIRLSLCRQHDIIVWHYTKDGKYNVRSGYHFAKELKIQDQHTANGSGAPIESLFWKSFWKVKVPPKVCNLLWQLEKAALPVKANLIRRGVDIQLPCLQCQNVETVEHLIWDYFLSRKIWGKVDMSALCDEDDLDIFAWLQHCFKVLLNSSLAQFMITVWGIWYARNQLCFENKSLSVDDIVQPTKLMLLYYVKANDVPVRDNIRSRSQSFWRAPHVGRCKLNVDAAYRNNIGAGFRAIIRDWNGGIVGSACSFKPYFNDPEIVEFQDLSFGLTFALDLSITHLDVEVDCASVVQLATSPSQISSYSSLLAVDVRQLFSCFVSSTITWIPREINVVAQALASYSFYDSFTYFFIENIPTNLFHLVDQDKCTVFS
ncbi:RNA binding protein, putative [Ricinus communis]|uniref:RNA binding protein, putative n=1 Tax=Ricinus communis TaxID=3988 RepID=B9S9H7_RICCO|nr:RNA binding protein, putative [Ricinus communis]